MFAQKSKLTPAADRHYTFIEALTTVEFAIVALMFFGCEITGIVFLSSASDMTQVSSTVDNWQCVASALTYTMLHPHSW